MRRLIDAEELKKRLYTANEIWSHGSHPRVVEEDDIDAMPTVDPVMHGSWIWHDYAWHCSNCGGLIATPGYMPKEEELAEKHKFCSLCGARMGEVTE